MSSGWMSKRLQAATGSRSERCFEPHKDPWDIAEEWIQVGGDEIRECLENACRTNGYRKLELNKCAFKYDHKWFQSHMYGSDPRCVQFASGRRNLIPEPILELDSAKGPLVIFETNVYATKIPPLLPHPPLSSPHSTLSPK